MRACEIHPERSTAIEGPDKITADLGSCPGCLDDQHGMEIQTSVDTGREGIRCGVCGLELDYGVVTDADQDLGVHVLCFARVGLYLSARGIVLW